MSSFRWITPPGVASVAVARLAGDLGGLELQDSRGRVMRWPDPGCVRRARPISEGRQLDDSLVVGLEDGAELHVHGGPGVVASVAAWLASAGFVSGTSDSARVVHSLRYARVLLSAESGPLARLSTEVAACLDGGAAPGDQLRELGLRSLALLTLSERLQRPAVVRLVGRPNAGKSTLFNALLGVERALVSPQAGTTRDTVAALWPLRGVPVILEDAAGVDQGDGDLTGADLVVRLLGPDEPARCGSRKQAGPPVLRLRGKADLLGRAPSGEGVSGRTGAGLPAFMESLAGSLGIPPESPRDLLAPIVLGLPTELARLLAVWPARGGS